MSTDIEKIGLLVSQVREQRGLTQTQLAQKLGTSQSAVNRIEKGKQNISLDMLGRISEALNKNIISVSSGSVSFKVEGGKELKGEITTSASKNASVALLCAALLNKGITKLNNVPKIEEVFRIIEVLDSIGVSVKWFGGNNLEIKPPAKLNMENINRVAARRTRTVIMFLGPLMHEFKEFNIPYAGGCKLGTRTVEPHYFALEKLGVEIVAKERAYHVTVKKKLTDEIVMSEMSETATENVIMAAARMDGITKITFASHNYMVRDLCYFLQKLGVRIDGVGTNDLVVHGVPNIKKNISYTPAEDPIESMSFLSIAATTNSSITIKRCPIDFLKLELLKLEKMGLKYTYSEKYKSYNGKSDLVDITTHKYESLHALTDKIHSMSYPAINMDNLPFFAPVAAVAKGRTLIHDWSYENRAIYLTELSRLGVNVTLADQHRIYIEGPTKFTPAEIITPPALRPAVIVLIAMLAAKGTSVLRNVYSITRGYEDLAERLNSIGAEITVLRDV